jgi:hypothetical protein
MSADQLTVTAHHNMTVYQVKTAVSERDGYRMQDFQLLLHPGTRTMCRLLRTRGSPRRIPDHRCPLITLSFSFFGTKNLNRSENRKNGAGNGQPPLILSNGVTLRELGIYVGNVRSLTIDLKESFVPSAAAQPVPPTTSKFGFDFSSVPAYEVFELPVGVFSSSLLTRLVLLLYCSWCRKVVGLQSVRSLLMCWVPLIVSRRAINTRQAGGSKQSSGWRV